ncbi:MAG: hypothetical protein R3C03_20300 [Pirellulaceae bacterium]
MNCSAAIQATSAAHAELVQRIASAEIDGLLLQTFCGTRYLANRMRSSLGNLRTESLFQDMRHLIAFDAAIRAVNDLLVSPRDVVVASHASHVVELIDDIEQRSQLAMVVERTTDSVPLVAAFEARGIRVFEWRIDRDATREQRTTRDVFGFAFELCDLEMALCDEVTNEFEVRWFVASDAISTEARLLGLPVAGMFDPRRIYDADLKYGIELARRLW